MGKHRTPYPAEFRAQMVELVKAGRRPEELEKEFEPTAQTIYNWVAQADRDTGVRHDGLTTAERQVLKFVNYASSVHRSANLSVNSASVPWLNVNFCSPNS